MLRSDFHGVSMRETKPGTVVSIVLSLISMAALSICFCMYRAFFRIKLIVTQYVEFRMSKTGPSCRSFAGVRPSVSSLPRLSTHKLVVILIIYSDSIVFTAGTAILSNGFGVDSSKEMCSRAVLLCLVCYMTTKVNIPSPIIILIFTIDRW
jgi:hypothetical protein